MSIKLTVPVTLFRIVPTGSTKLVGGWGLGRQMKHAIKCFGRKDASQRLIIDEVTEVKMDVFYFTNIQQIKQIEFTSTTPRESGHGPGGRL